MGRAAPVGFSALPYAQISKLPVQTPVGGQPRRLLLPLLRPLVELRGVLLRHGRLPGPVVQGGRLRLGVRRRRTLRLRQPRRLLLPLLRPLVELRGVLLRHGRLPGPVVRGGRLRRVRSVVACGPFEWPHGNACSVHACVQSSPLS